ncbi:Transcription initiation factor TFIIB, Brf1 subunit/Transcription initiation factor TFIIB (plasmid) [Halapricum desulfuricans]|uniref:Transcription initiation factor IIB n=1 Tax=Halapricum desulfuricans TaxID=2841257 RepID=A0A897NG99_9EURY|nr:transcription initiation factor IIB family protein [Halapricum desulfuricans]QSG13470.1 Transcription initiation factor TFIIB, Brf1 subunit/Transcription initiation factor TFIIB [Halapricum desulfuricans]
MATRDIYESGFDEDVQTESSANQCPECDGWVTTNAVETVCEDCGLVINEQRIDHGPEWRAYDDEECKRTGAPLTAARHDRGLSTKIGRGTDAKGNELSGQKRRRLARMRREQTRGRWRSKAERNLAHGLGEVRRLASALELSDSVRDQACQLFRSAQNEDLLRGRSIEAIAAASVYGACRCNGRSRLVDDVSEMARVAESRVTNAYKTLNEELGLPAEPVSPSMFVPRLASDLECPDRIRQRARTLAEQAEKCGVTTGVHPAGFAAACLYKAGREEGRWLTQRDVAESGDVTPTTVRTHQDTLQQLNGEQRVGTKSITQKRGASAESRG